MRIDQALATRRPFFSFEFFPPKSDEGQLQLLRTIETLCALHPSFVSVTYGAGGSTRGRTTSLTKQIQNQIGLTAMAHVTCVGHSRRELRDIFYDLEQAGIENVLALRGDPPRGELFTQPQDGFAYASDLVTMLARDFRFTVGGAAYPEKHLEAESFEADLQHLSLKVRAGAQFLITQLFFDNAYYFAFIKRAREAGITVPILPGIMPITSFEQIARLTAMCGAAIPPKLYAELYARADQPDAVKELGVSYATLQCQDLLARGAPGIHFYTLNKSPATRAVVSALLAATAWHPTPRNDAFLA